MARRRTALSAPHRIDEGASFRLRDHATDSTGVFRGDKDAGRLALAESLAELAELQRMLYAQDRWAVLLVFQAMDAAGKDGVIKEVVGAFDPQGCETHAFKAPTAHELDHDFLWRCVTRVPERGRVGVFNRSYYEEVLIVRVHRAILEGQKLPREVVGPKIFEERLEDIAAYERYLVRNGVLVLKFFLNVSLDAQRERFLERLEEPEKHWKFELADVRERGHWGEYMKAYEAAIRATATPQAPWYVVPADRKWYARLVVADAVREALRGLKLAFPASDPKRRGELDAARKALLAEGAGAKRAGAAKGASSKPEKASKAKAEKPKRSASRARGSRSRTGKPLATTGRG